MTTSSLVEFDADATERATVAVSVDATSHRRRGGYLTSSHDAANVLFHVFSDRQLKEKSMVFTTRNSTCKMCRQPPTSMIS
jgi:hypothetical protein